MLTTISQTNKKTVVKLNITREELLEMIREKTVQNVPETALISIIVEEQPGVEVKWFLDQPNVEEYVDELMKEFRRMNPTT